MEQDWKEESGKLTKTFLFKNFVEALALVNKVGEIAESTQHHPNISIQNYKEVMISTTTHDAGNVVTDKDRKLAETIDAL
mgnify:CR=1 FL=1